MKKFVKYSEIKVLIFILYLHERIYFNQKSNDVFFFLLFFFFVCFLFLFFIFFIYLFIYFHFFYFSMKTYVVVTHKKLFVGVNTFSVFEGDWCAVKQRRNNESCLSWRKLQKIYQVYLVPIKYGKIFLC